MIKRLFLLVILLLASIPCFGQSVDTAWVRRYNGPADTTDEAYAIAVDGSGNVYVTGYSTGSGTAEDYATIKYHSNGDTAWVRRYNGPGNDEDFASAIAVDSSGNAYVTGWSWNGTDFDCATIKYYSNGDTASRRSYRGGGFDIAVDGFSNVYVAGATIDSITPADSGDYLSMKYYPNGDTYWVRTYSGTGNYDIAWAIAVDGSGNVCVTGGSRDTATLADWATIKYYPNGETAWVRRYNGPGNGTEQAQAITTDDWGNVYVTGNSWGGLETQLDCATIKYYPDGDTAWVRTYKGPGNSWDDGRAIAVDGSGNAYVTGSSFGDYVTIKYYENGDTAWVRRYNGPGNGEDCAYAIAVDRSGNVYVTGESPGSGPGWDYATIKYLPNGDTAWVTRYNGPENNDDRASAIAVDDSGNVYVTGYSWGSTAFDYCTIKYVQTGTGVKDETEDRGKPSEFALSQNYPNPFNPATIIPFTVHGEQKTVNSSIRTTLTIYNILGQKVRTLVDEDKVPGEYQVVWDGKNDSGKKVGSGIYFYRLKIGDFSEAKRSVLLK